MVDACTYEVGENLLATDSGLLYDAKVMRVKEGKGKDGAAAEPSYFIHFNKWNTRWDRWVPASGLRKLNDENKEVQRRLKSAADEAKIEAKTTKKKERPKAEKPAKDPKPVKPKKPRVVDNDLEDDTEQVQIKLNLTQTLKRLLVEDWENITQEPRKWVPLPRTPSVEQILTEFLDSKRDGAHLGGGGAKGGKGKAKPPSEGASASSSSTGDGSAAAAASTDAAAASADADGDTAMDGVAQSATAADAATADGSATATAATTTVAAAAAAERFERWQELLNALREVRSLGRCGGVAVWRCGSDRVGVVT